MVKLPIIGIVKRNDPGFAVSITPDFAAAQEVAAAGADVVALDATGRPSAGGPLRDLIARIGRDLGRPVMADVATFEQGIAAAAMGARYVATTLAGYTGGPVPEGPDLDLLRSLAETLGGREDVAVIAEGRFADPADIRAAFAIPGVHAVVVGTAITNPREITRRFAAAAPFRP